MKKILVLVLSSDFTPYDKMIDTSLSTWDSVEVEGVETIFYCSQQDNLNKSSTDKIKRFDVGNTLFDMGWKNILMFEWALKNKEFDYVLRLNASQYCDKKRLIEQVQSLPEHNLFMGVEADSVHGKYCWGGTGFLLSKDVIEKIVENKSYWQHDKMEDMAISKLISELGIPVIGGIKSCSIDRKGDNWQCISYYGSSIDFSDFNDLKPLGHIVYRIKQDGQRWVDEILMQTLFQTLDK